MSNCACATRHEDYQKIYLLQVGLPWFLQIYKFFQHQTLQDSSHSAICSLNLISNSQKNRIIETALCEPSLKNSLTSLSINSLRNPKSTRKREWNGRDSSFLTENSVQRISAVFYCVKQWKRFRTQHPLVKSCRKFLPLKIVVSEYRGYDSPWRPLRHRIFNGLISQMNVGN